VALFALANALTTSLRAAVASACVSNASVRRWVPPLEPARRLGVPRRQRLRLARRPPALPLQGETAARWQRPKCPLPQGRICRPSTPRQRCRYFGHWLCCKTNIFSLYDRMTMVARSRAAAGTSPSPRARPMHIEIVRAPKSRAAEEAVSGAKVTARTCARAHAVVLQRRGLPGVRLRCTKGKR
jgi:hypothetical protein